MSIKRTWGYTKIQTQYFISTALNWGRLLELFAEKSKVGVRQIGVKRLSAQQSSAQVF